MAFLNQLEHILGIISGRDTTLKDKLVVYESSLADRADGLINFPEVVVGK